MFGLVRAVVVFALWLVSLPAAFAITFNYIGGDVSGVSIPSGQTGTIGTDGWFVQMPTFFQIGANQKQAHITLQVQADTGYYLSGVTLDPNGSVQGDAQVTVNAVHPGSSTASFYATSTAIQQLGSVNSVLSGQNNSYTVSFDLTLLGANSTSISKVSVFQVFYQQAPVPEPSSMLALAAGLGMIRGIRRKGIRNS